MGYRMFVMVLLTICVGVMDGMGLTMFLPLFQIAADASSEADSTIVDDNFMVSLMQSLHIPVDLWGILGLMLSFYIIKGIFNFFKTRYNTDIARYFMLRTRKRLLAAFNQISYKYFVSANVGRIQNIMTGELTTVYNAFIQYINIVQQVIMIAIYMGFAIVINAQFAIFITIGALLFNFIFKKIYKVTKESSRSRVTASNTYQGLIIQFVNNFKYLKATGLFEHYSHKVNDSIEAIEIESRKMGYMGAIANAIREPTLILIVCAVILLHVYGFGGNLGTIMVSLLFFYRALTAVTFLQMSMNTFNTMVGTIENVEWFENELLANREVHAGKKDIGKLTDQLTLENVDFSYGTQQILKNINLKVFVNKTTAIVGESGSGKTTLVNILSGLFPIENGDYTIDGIPAKEVDLKNFQKQIGYISQDPVIFNDTIYNNVTFWATYTPQNIQRFKNALQRAALLEFVSDLTNQENTLLGNNGVNLSGGQKQRISIARELFKEAQILIFDEATSALDSGTEKTIQHHIDMLKGDYTIIIIAHRMATIKNVDNIIYLEQGRIIAEGGFDELIKKSTTFKSMVESQNI